jgi:histidyl-tRNA synthetase
MRGGKLDMNTEIVKGFRDYTGEEAWKRVKIKDILEKTFQIYGFEPAETPIIEQEEFVVGNNSGDEAVSDRYKLEDKGKRKLALRYEFTFQLKRIANNKKLPWKRYQIGPVFRDEPINANRVRQLTQCDIDVIGSTLKDEAEILKTFSEALKKLGISCKIYLNNRKLLNEILEDLKINEKDREQVIREIDKLDKLPKEKIKENLKKFKAEKALDIFTKPEKYFEKYSAYKAIKELKEICKNYKVEFEFSPFLARGLSYYNGTVFEIKTDKIKETICGGGSYIINGIQATGISASIERLEILAKIKDDSERYLIVSLDEDKKAIELAQKLREKEKEVVMFYGKPSKALEYANSYKINKVIFVGKDEVKAKKFKVKDMLSGKESLLKI